MHDIGKNLVGMMLEGAGFEVIDLGVDTTKEKFMDAAEKKSRFNNWNVCIAHSYYEKYEGSY